MQIRMRTTRILSIALLAFLVALTTSLLAGCDDEADDGAEVEIETEDDIVVEDGDDLDLDEEIEVETEPAPAPSDDTGDEAAVTLYFAYGGDSALAVERTVTEVDGLPETAMTELLAGPTEDEMSVWPALATEIPDGTELRGLEIQDGVAMVDLSPEFEEGGGTASITTRVAQVVYTLTAFDEVRGVEFYLDGERVEVFSGEGLILDEPQTREDYEELVPIEA